MFVMYYEYHLENGIIINSTTPNISFFDGYEEEYCQCCGNLIDGYYRAEVKYCLIKEGDKPLTEEELEDMNDRMSSMD